MTHQPLTIQQEHDGKTSILRLGGDITTAGVDALDAACTTILERKPMVVIIDATRLAFASSIGMGCFIRLYRELKEYGGHVRVAGASPMVKGSLNRAKLLGLFTFHPDVASARML